MGHKSIRMGNFFQEDQAIVIKPCSSYPGYSATDGGEIITHRKRFGLGKGKGGGVRVDLGYSKTLNQFIGHGGYVYVSVHTPRGQRSTPIHVLLADAFIGPRPEGMEVRHLDGNPTNNDLKNLDYGTRQQNANDRVLHGTQPRGSRQGRVKLDEASVVEIRKMYNEGISIAAISRKFMVGESTAREVIQRKKWKHVD